MLSYIFRTNYLSWEWMEEEIRLVLEERNDSRAFVCSCSGAHRYNPVLCVPISKMAVMVTGSQELIIF